jgi:hypothetical protein
MDIDSERSEFLRQEYRVRIQNLTEQQLGPNKNQLAAHDSPPQM